MVEETVHYKDDSGRYMRVLEILIKNTEVSISMIVQRVMIIAGLIVPLMSFLLSIMIPQFFEGIMKLIGGNINLIKIAWDYISLGGIVNILLGVITLVITFVLNSTLILFLVILLVLELLFFKNKRVQSKMERWFGFTSGVVGRNSGTNILKNPSRIFLNSRFSFNFQ